MHIGQGSAVQYMVRLCFVGSARRSASISACSIFRERESFFPTAISFPLIRKIAAKGTGHSLATECLAIHFASSSFPPPATARLYVRRATTWRCECFQNRICRFTRTCQSVMLSINGKKNSHSSTVDMTPKWSKQTTPSAPRIISTGWVVRCSAIDHSLGISARQQKGFCADQTTHGDLGGITADENTIVPVLFGFEFEFHRMVLRCVSSVHPGWLGR